MSHDPRPIKPPPKKSSKYDAVKTQMNHEPSNCSGASHSRITPNSRRFIVLVGLIGILVSRQSRLPPFPIHSADSFRYTFQWSFLQIFRSTCLPIISIVAGPSNSLSSYRSLLEKYVDAQEEKIWSFWETHHHHHQQQHLTIPTIDLQHLKTGSNEAIQKLQEEFQTVDLTQPLLLRSFWDDDSLSEPSQTAIHRSLSLKGLKLPPMSDIIVDYFKDASATFTVDTRDNNKKDGYNGILKPDGKAPIGEIVHNITKRGGKQKFGTQVPVETFPHLLRELIPISYQPILTQIFGDFFEPHHIQGSGPFSVFPGRTTVPLFLAGAIKPTITSVMDEKESKENNAIIKLHSAGKPRTDLHCEPIGNIAIHLHGEKRWTLISPSYSHLLRPSISRHGRAFFYSNLERNLNKSNMYSNIPQIYQVITKAGDALWVPPWMWHRVDYIEDSVALAASIFHFRAMEFWSNNGLFAALVVPNLVKELFRLQTE